MALGSRLKSQCWMQRAVVLIALICGSALGCKAKPAPVAPPLPAKPEAKFAAAPAAVPADQPGSTQGMRAHLNLLNLAHLADVDQGGLFLDFGTPARMKYTVGNWKTGFGKDGADGKTTWTRVGAVGRVYLPLPSQGPVTIRFRMKPIGTQKFQLYVNSKPLPLVNLTGGKSFAIYDVPVGPELIKEGENQLLLRFGDTVKREDEDVAVEIDYIRVLSGALAQAGSAPDTLPAAAPAGPSPDVPPAGSELPFYDQLVQEVSVGGSKRRALVQQGPGKLSFYVEVPAKASLSFRVGQSAGTGATAKVLVQADGAEAKQVFTHALGAQWVEKIVPLASFAGQVVRIDLAAEGAGLVAWSSPSIIVPEVEVKKPEPAKSVVLLLVDTLRADKLHAYNPESRVQMPAFDAFAKEGTVFVNAQAPENWTKPSVASVLTGLYPSTHGAKQSDSRLPDGVLMVSEVFKQQGYTTAAFLANGYVSDKFGFDQGWDKYTNYVRENKSTTAENVFKEAGDFIEAHKSERFFVYIQTVDPHVPYDPPEKYLKTYDPEPYTGIVSPGKTPEQLEQAKRNPPALIFNDRDRAHLEALYDGEVAFHDEHFGRLVERLRKLGLYDQIFFAVTADHGEEFYDHGSYGHGHTVYQELIHVPLMFRGPGVVPAGKRIEETVGTVDVTPTLLAAAGITVPEVMEGRDRMAHMLGRVPAVPAVAFSDFLDDRRVIRAGRFKLILAGINATFFDLQADPHEREELSAQSQPIARRYCRMLLGQFLGARSLRDWLSADQRAPSQRFNKEAADIDEKTRQGLKALGYAN